MRDGCADTTLRLNAKAWAVLHLLAEMPPEFAAWDEKLREYRVELKTFPWFNGRERGMVLTLQHNVIPEKALHVAFAECRGGEEIFVEVWEDKAPFNAPTVGTCDPDTRDEAYRNRELFQHAEEAARYAYDAMAEYYEKGKVE